MKKKKTVKRILLRALQTIPLLVIVTILTFVLLHFAPGDPAQLMLGNDATPEKVAALREELGLDNPLYVQVWDFIKGVVLRGDFGVSYQSRQPVVDDITRTLPVTIQLSLIGIVVSTIVGVFVGVISAVRQYSLMDNTIRVVVLLAVSMPAFWLGLMLLLVFSVQLMWLPSYGWGSFQQIILPSITVSTFPLAMITRMTRSNMLEVIRQDYIRTARAKGLSSNSVIYRHALRNAFIPVITIIGLQLGVLLTGAVLAETVFALPGLGRLIVSSVYARDYPLIRAAVIYIAFIVMVINLVVDVVYTLLDPRIELH